MPKGQQKASREDILEGLLRNLLEEVSVRDATGHQTDQWCCGCQGRSRHVRACVSAREFLKVKPEVAAVG